MFIYSSIQKPTKQVIVTGLWDKVAKPKVLIPFLLLIAFSAFVIATQCYSYTASSTCTAVSGCTWKNDSWGSWCQELNCWSLPNQSACTTTSVPGKQCQWQTGRTTYSCDQVSCWSFSGTTAAQCVNNTYGKGCSWQESCYNKGSGGSGSAN